MKHILLIAGLGALGYCYLQQQQAQSLTTVAVASGGVATAPLNGGVANTSGYGGGSAATNIGAGVGTSSTMPSPVKSDSPSALAFFGGGARAHPLDF